MVLKNLNGSAFSLCFWVVMVMYILCTHLVANVSGAAIGIDFGSQLVKVALVQPNKPFNIVVDEQTKRKWRNVVGFDQSERLFGNNAASLETKRPHLHYNYIPWLLGESIDSPVIKRLKETYFPYELVSDEERGTVRVVYGADDDGNEVSYSAEEIVAMSLQYAKRVSDMEGGGDIKDCVITVPSFYSQKQRQAMLDAAHVANLNVLSLINENTAFALQYGIDRQYSVDVVEHFIIFNMGASKTEASLVKYSAYEGKKKNDKPKGQINILATAYDRFLGGLAFDVVLMERLADEATEQLQKQKEIGPDEDVRLFPRTMARLRKAAVRAKQILSANKDTTVNIEGLYKDIDFRYKITREDFHEDAEGLFGRVLAPVKAVLKDAKLSKNDINGIVLVGGSTRVPRVQKILQDFIGGELNQDLNADEAAALGATFRAANLSTTFRVRQIGLVDVSPYPVGIRLSDIPLPPGSPESEARMLDMTFKPFTKRATLFNPYNIVDKRKSVAFTHDRDFHIRMHNDKAQLLPEGTTAQIGTFNVTGLEELALEHAERGKPKVQLSFELNANGLVELVSAKGSYTEEVQVKVEKKKKKKNRRKKDKDKKSDEDSESSDEDADVNKSEGDKTEGEKTEGDETEGDNDNKGADGETATENEKNTENGAENDEDDGGDGDEPVSEEPEYRMENKTTSYPLRMSRGGADMIPMTTKNIRDSQDILRALDDRDEATRATAAALNSLESYIYQARDALEKEGIDIVSTEEERTIFRGALTDAEDWLYEDDEDRTATTYADKMGEVQDLGDDIFYRFSEYMALPQYLESAQAAFESARNFAGELAEKMPWIEDSVREKFLEGVDKAELWLAERATEQEALPKTENPTLTTKAIQKKLEKIKEEATTIMRTPEPPPPKPKKSKKKNDTETGGDDEEGIDVEGEPDAEQENQDQQDEADSSYDDNDYDDDDDDDDDEYGDDEEDQEESNEGGEDDSQGEEDSNAETSEDNTSEDDDDDKSEL